MFNEFIRDLLKCVTNLLFIINVYMSGVIFINIFIIPVKSIALMYGFGGVLYFVVSFGFYWVIVKGFKLWKL